MDHNQILQFVRTKGPILPVQLATELKQNLIIAGAVLSELAKSGKILISNTKVGGSPVYYVIEQQYKLQDLFKHLNEKDQRAYDFLKKKQVVRDRELTPLLRVSLRNIKDFAKPIEVKVGQETEIFWRWYLVPMSQAEPIVRAFFKSQTSEKPTQKPMPKAETKPEEKTVPKAEKTPQPTSAQTKTPPSEAKPEAQKTLDGEPTGDSLHEKTKRFFNNHNILILNADVIRKKSEIDYVLDVPSPIGKIRYYCKAKSKKRISDSDLAQAFVKGQMKKLPVLFVTTGQLTKKALEMLDKEFDNLKVKTLEAIK